MKTAVFNLIDPEFEVTDKRFDVVKEVYVTPTLPAYAILNSNIDRSCETIDLMYMPQKHEILGDKTIINGVNLPLPVEVRSATLTVNYSGIRDYSLLFPQVANKKLKGRLGHRNGRITTHYSAAKPGNLIDAANRVCEKKSRTGNATILPDIY